MRKNNFKSVFKLWFKYFCLAMSGITFFMTLLLIFGACVKYLDISITPTNGIIWTIFIYVTSMVLMALVDRGLNRK